MYIYVEETITFVQNGAIPVEQDIHALALALARAGGEGGSAASPRKWISTCMGGGEEGVNPHASKLA